MKKSKQLFSRKLFFIILVGILFLEIFHIYATEAKFNSVVSNGSVYLEEGFTFIIEPNSARSFNFTIPNEVSNATIKSANLIGGFIVKPILGVPQTIGFVIKREDGTVSIATETSSWEGVLQGLSPEFTYELIFANRDMISERDVRITSTFEYSYVTEPKLAPTQQDERSICLITAAFIDTALEPEIFFLRHIRDETLTEIFGKDCVEYFNIFYYSFSPQIAESIRENLWIKVSTITILLPIVGVLHFVDLILKTSFN